MLERDEISRNDVIDKDEVLKMARQAASHGVENHRSGEVSYVFYNEHLMNFAKLVDAKATAREREACAKVCDDLYRVWTLTDEDDLNPPDALDCKRAIRARSETTSRGDQ